MIDRRLFVAGGAALLAGAAGPAAVRTISSPFAAIRDSLGRGGRLGVAALDTRTGRTLRFDAESRYAMCSTFKWVLAAFVLAEAERRRLTLAEELPFGEGDLVSHAPVVQANLARGRLPIERLCAAIVEVSDNAAANLLLRRTGGPAALTAFIRRHGDRITRLDRYETELNSNIAGDPRDTTTPAAMLGLMRTLLVGNALRQESRFRLGEWMVGATTGLRRLRAGLPEGWWAGDKTGNGANGAANDVAIAWPPTGRPVLIASYMDAPAISAEARDAAHAAVARAIAAGLD